MLKEIVRALYDYYYLCYGENPAEKGRAYDNIVEIAVNISQLFQITFNSEDKATKNKATKNKATKNKATRNIYTKLRDIEIDTSQIINSEKKLKELERKSQYYKSFIN